MRGRTKSAHLLYVDQEAWVKTELAAKFVSSHKDRFDAIFWIYADQAAKLAEGFGRIALALGLIPGDSVNARDQVVTRDVE